MKRKFDFLTIIFLIISLVFLILFMPSWIKFSILGLLLFQTGFYLYNE